jgi:hypothetical protein
VRYVAEGLGDALVEAFGTDPAVARCAERLESAARLAARGSPRLEANLWSTRSTRELVGRVRQGGSDATPCPALPVLAAPLKWLHGLLLGTPAILDPAR